MLKPFQRTVVLIQFTKLNKNFRKISKVIERSVVSVHTESWQCVPWAMLVKMDYKNIKHLVEIKLTFLNYSKAIFWTAVMDSRPFGENVCVSLKTRELKDQHPTRWDTSLLCFWVRDRRKSPSPFATSLGRMVSHHITQLLPLVLLTWTKKCFIPNHCEVESEQSEGKYLICSYFHS